MMDKIKSHFVLLLCYDKIEPELEVQKMLKVVIFLCYVSILFRRGVLCLSCQFWGRNWHLHYSNGAE